MPNILVVDDELSIRESFSLILEGNYNVLLAASGEAALKIATDQKINLVYLDIRMPGMDGLETLKKIKELSPDLEVIMVTAVNEVQKASEAVRHGARDYVVKPFDVEHITKLTEQVLRKKSILEQGDLAQKGSQARAPALIGQSEKIEEITRFIATIKDDQRVLILGEVGTEKEHVARLIHSKSSRRLFPFKKVDLANRLSPAEIRALCSERDKDGGTLYINNLESLPEDSFKLLTAQASSRLIGSSSADPININRKIFRYFSEIHITLPALRERTSDIPLLINYFIEHYSARYAREVVFEPIVVEALINYSWPGNTRQLQALLERLILSCSDSEIKKDDLPIEILMENSKPLGGDLLFSFQRAYAPSGKTKKK
jgi:two-component system response regulator HydG